MTSLRTPSSDGRENKRVLFEEYTDSNEVEPTLVTDPSISTGSIALRAPSTNQGVVFIGWGDDVDLESGFPIYKRDLIAIDLDAAAQNIYAVSDTNADELRVLTTN